MSLSSKPRILYWPHVPYKAQYFLRYVWPASRLIRNGYEVKLIDPRYISAWDENAMADDFAWADIVVMFNPKTLVGPRALELCLQYRKKLIADTDDMTFEVDFSNIAYEWSGTEDVPGLWTSGIQYDRADVKSKQVCFEKTLMLCDALTVTQPVLARMHESYVGRGEIYVLPNSLDLDFYKPWERRASKNEIRIGWQGGASHWRDMKIVEGPLTEIKRKHSNVKFVFFGQAFPDMQKAFPDAEYHPWVDQDTFHVKLGSLDLDIGLCPLEDTGFNRGKSNLKMIEYGVFGVPSICSSISEGPYNEALGEDRLLVENTDEAWFEAIDGLIGDKNKRKHIGDNARKTVENVYNIDVTWRFWAECYGDVHERVVGKPL